MDEDESPRAAAAAPVAEGKTRDDRENPSRSDEKHPPPYHCTVTTAPGESSVEWEPGVRKATNWPTAGETSEAAGETSGVTWDAGAVKWIIFIH